MKNLVVWICNGAIALLSVLAIVGYFFFPFWSINVAYTVTGMQLEEMLGENVSDLEIDFNDIVGEEGIKLSLALHIDTGIVLGSLDADAEKTVSSLVESNVDSLIDQLSGTLEELIPKVVKSIAKQMVRNEVRDQFSKLLESNGSGSGNSVEERLKEAGLDNLLNDKIDGIIDTLFDSSVQKTEFRNEILTAVDDVYESFKNSSDEDLKTLTLSDDERASLEEQIDEVLEMFADENGVVDVAGFLDEFLSQAMGSFIGSTERVVPLAAESNDEDSLNLKEALKDVLMNMLDGAETYLVLVLRILLLLWVLSSLAWVYILVKLLVKLVTKGEPTVKLKMPIILGWLPYLILVLLPTIAMALLKGKLGAMLPEAFASASIGFASSGLIALIAAVVCIGISIFYIIVRKRS